jgi:hypothetical protein
LFNELHDIIFYGKGGYSWDSLYNMPIKYRKYILKKMTDFYDPKDKNTLDNPSEDVKQMAKRPPTDYMYAGKKRKASRN